MIENYLPQLSEPLRRWVRFAVLLAVLALLCWVLYGLRGVFTPLLIAAALAYIFNPLVSWFEHRRHASRLAVVSVVFVLLGVVVIGGGAYVVSATVSQLVRLYEDLPQYVEIATRWLDSPLPQWSDASALPSPDTLPASAPATTPAATSPADGAPPPTDTWRTYATEFAREHGTAIATTIWSGTKSFFSNVFNLFSLLVLVPVFTFYFLWRFDDLVRAVRDHLPVVQRDRIIYVVRTIDGAVANFFRGRLIVCAIMGVLTAVGWTLVGVPYSLPLGFAAGLFNLVPFMSLLALPPALFFAFVGAEQADESWVVPVVLVMLVYMAVQGLESFLLSPAIEGKSSGLHPLVIIVAIMIGAELAGLLGMLLAIPIASTLKVFGREWLMPEVRRLAALAPGPDSTSP